MVQTPIDSLAAPSNDGELLIWPEARELPALFEKNQKLRRSYKFELLGRNAQESISPSLDSRVIATGHQPGFLHPGVWIKNVAASVLAGQIHGIAQFLVVDNDALQQSALKWPERTNGSLRLRSAFPFQLPLDSPYELLPVSTSEQWRRFFASLPESIRSNAQSPMPGFLDDFLHDGTDRSYVPRWIEGLSAMEKTLDVPQPEYLPVSRWFDVTTSDAAACFFGHLLIHAGDFAAAYNEALNNYRQRRGIRGHQHPIPDLVIMEERIEVPFWGVHPDKSRLRLYVQQLNDQLALFAGEERIAVLHVSQLNQAPGAHLKQALGSWRIRPRALTLTMFSRLFCSDLFIHGIGGAKYDQICDDCIKSFFQVEPPAYACVSATLRLDLPRFEASVIDLIRCRRDLRDKRFNPQRFLINEDSAVKSLCHERDTAIALAEKLRSNDRDNHSVRRTTAERIRSINASLAARIPMGEVCDPDTLEDRVAQNRIADYREWFMGFYPREKLARLADNTSAALKNK